MVDNMLGPCELWSVSAQGYHDCQLEILTQHWHGWVSLVCSVEIDLSCICYILFSPQSSTVLQWNVQFTLCSMHFSAKHHQLAPTQPSQTVLLKPLKCSSSSKFFRVPFLQVGSLGSLLNSWIKIQIQLTDLIPWFTGGRHQSKEEDNITSTFWSDVTPTPVSCNELQYVQ